MTHTIRTLISALALCLPLSALAAPDAGRPADDVAALARGMAAEYEVEAEATILLADPLTAPLVYSAARCEAQQRLTVTIEALDAYPSRALILAAATARANIDSAERHLVGYDPIACDDPSVAAIVECLDATAPSDCGGFEVSAYVRAVEASR